MLRNYLIVAFRNLFRNKLYSLINISGLAIGMAAAFFIFQYVYFERGHDRFHKNAPRLYRVGMSFPGNGATDLISAFSHPATGPAMKADFPEVVDFVRLSPPTVFMRTSTMEVSEANGSTKRFNEANLFFADASFFSLFSFPLAAGDAKTSLAKPNSVVISESIAKKYFGKTQVLGKTVSINQHPLTVTAVCKDVPENSHVKFDLLISFSTIDERFGYDNWGWPEFYNYVLLAPGADVKKFEAKLPAFTEKYLAGKMKEFNFRAKFHLQLLTDIHLDSNYRNGPEPVGNKKTVYFLSILGIFILVIAWINYVNLTTAKSLERAREVGLRKVVGAGRWQLARQFLLEALLINCMALVIAAVIVILCNPLFDSFIGKRISQSFLSSGLWHTATFWLVFFGIFIAGALQTGAYPAFILSAFKPVLVLKGKFHRSNKGIVLRKSLVTFQFVLSILLIAGTLIVYRQLHYMQHRDLGYNKDQVLVVKAPAVYDSTFNSKVYAFKNELLKQPDVNNMAPSTEIPGRRIFARNTARRAGRDLNAEFVPYLVEIDNSFLPTFNIPLACGSNLAEKEPGTFYETKRANVLINEESVKRLGYASNDAALNQTIYFTSWFGEIECQVTGVVKNYHQRSLKEAYDPIIYYPNDRSNWAYFSINMNASNPSKDLAAIEKLYTRFFPGNAFESFFLNEYFNRQYQADIQFGNIFSLFTVLAIFIACLGLTGLATYAIKLRTKEIGIRKVLGASAQGIVYLFYRDFIQLVCLAAVIAIPVVYFLADKWLSNFAFHIQLGWFVFIAAPMLLMLLAFVTIGLQSVRAALDNPVNSLRND